MRLFIIAAMQEEALGLIEDKRFKFKENKKDIFRFFDGKYNKTKVSLVLSGVGRVNSAMAVEAIYSNYKVTKDDLFINIGCSGAIEPLKKCEIYASSSFVYGDCDLQLGGSYRYGQMSQCPFEFKFESDEISKVKKVCGTEEDITVQSNESFVTDFEKLSKLLSEYYQDLKCYLFEMEAACLAQAIIKHGGKLVSIKYVSDIIGSANQCEDYYDNCERDKRSSHELLRDAIVKYLEF